VDDRCEAWTSRYDGPAGGTDAPAGELAGSLLIASSPDSKTVFAVGASDSNPSTATDWSGIDFDLMVVANDTTAGEQKWAFRLPQTEQTYAHAIVADPDGDLVYATGHDYEDPGDCSRQSTTVAIDVATGTQAWTARETTPDGECISVQATTIDPTGERFFSVGTSEPEGGHSAMTVIARDAGTGAELWRITDMAGSPMGATGTALATSADGTKIYASGSILTPDVYGYPRHTGWALRGFDAATGERTLDSNWTTPAPQVNSPSNPPAALAVSPDGSRLHLVGGVDHGLIPSRFFDITTVTFDAATGQQVWLSRYDGPRDKSSFDSVWYNGPLALSRDGTRIAIAGYSTHLIGVNLQLDLVTTFLDTADDGRALWATRYTAENETNWIPSVALSPDATEIYVAAPSRYAVQWELPARYTALAYRAADGTVAWTGRHSDGHSFAMGSVLTPDGKNFVVTGMTAEAGQRTLSTPDWGMGLAAYAT
jgi:hypothetical protein